LTARPFPDMPHFQSPAVLVLVAALLFFGLGSTVSAREMPGSHALATAHPLATAAGEAVLAAGGNAFDAAVAVTAALGVAEPQGSGLGGGGFFLLYEAATGQTVMLDARETAPALAHRDLYLDADGEVIPGLSLDGVLAAAIPGIPAGLVHLAERYGRLPLVDSLTPAIRLAEDGVPVDAMFLQMAAFRLQALRDGADAAVIFLREGELPEEGALLRQPDLADTLRQLAEQGNDGFYRGAVAQRLVDAVVAGGGIWTLQDLEAYVVVERTPVVLEYAGARIITAAPPSSGGIAIGQILRMLAAGEMPAGESARVHLMIEAMRRAYRDRAAYLGDPDHVSIPVSGLLSPDYALELRSGIDPHQATPSAELPLRSDGAPAGLRLLASESAQTTHFSILDAWGNRVAGTITLNYPFGSGFVAPGTGVLLNNEMDDFSARPGVPNAYGLIGFEANAIAPNRRPLSSMSPTFVETGDRVAILGTPGGSRIITMVLQGILSVLEGQDAGTVVRLPRFHHQYLPDRIDFETGALSVAVQRELVQRGHQLRPQLRPFGNMQVVIWDRAEGTVQAASDPRGSGTATVIPTQ